MKSAGQRPCGRFIRRHTDALGALRVQPPAPTGPLEKYKLARACIEHENALIAQRITWFLTLQGFLFAAYFLVTRTALESGEIATAVRLLTIAAIWVISLLGIGSSVVVYCILEMALQELLYFASWWQEQKGREEFPRVTREDTGMHAHTFALAFVLAWICLLVVFHMVPP